MPRTYVGRVAASAVISAALAVGSLSLATPAAGACTDPDCTRGVPPALACSEPSCLSGTRPAAAPWPGSRRTGQAGHGGQPARAADRVSTAVPPASAQTGRGTASAAPINCPPPNPSVTAPTSDC
jgi:hypothetical protein